MDEILQRLAEGNFSELAGLTLDASIPLSEQLVNEFVGSALQGNKNITSCYVAIHRDNKIVVNLRTPFWPLPIDLKLRLEPSADFTNGPKVKASLENYALLGKLITSFKALPQGIIIQDEEVIIDVRSFLSTAQQQKWLDLIKSVQIKTEEAKLHLDIHIKVE